MNEENELKTLFYAVLCEYIFQLTTNAQQNSCKR